MPETVIEGAEMDAVLRFVERGLGVAIVPAVVLAHRPGLRSVRLTRPTLARTISVARTADVARVPCRRGDAAHDRGATATALATTAGATMRLA